MLKFLFIFLTIVTLQSCTSTHYHDGNYGVDMLGVVSGSMKISGNEIYYKISVPAYNDSAFEFKTKCDQFEDRIEFINDKGATTIGRFNENGDLVVMGFTFKKMH